MVKHLSKLVATSGERWEIISLYKSLGLNLQTKLGFSHIAFESGHIGVYVKKTISIFKVIHKATQGQAKLLFKKDQILFYVFVHDYKAYCKYFQTTSKSSIFCDQDP